ncbi:hypothetical protein AaE_014768 [Aphanomyces astaci]|uniref:RRM domain-containing protein n=1 Tax=Aphanomyces astaci TaxID=112090 RepID=A0A6A4YYL7_APHAT|nr:hypothetical protein AaE_014768 [Aphanomyces astaci]
MSSLLNSLDMSLDDLIDKKKSSSNKPAREGRSGGGGGGGGPVRRNRANTGRGRRNAEPYSRKNDDDDDMGEGSGNKSGKRASILSRLGGRVNNEEAGHKIFVTNLKFDVLEDDLKELFGTVGKVSKAEIVYDKSGRSKGTARVWFVRRNDAEQAVKRYDGRLLDDQALKIVLDDAATSGNGNANPRNNNNSSQRRHNANDGNNVRQGVFGTALDDNDEPSGGRRNGGGRRNRRGGGGGRSNNKSAKDLDNDMDTYHADL